MLLSIKLLRNHSLILKNCKTWPIFLSAPYNMLMSVCMCIICCYFRQTSYQAVEEQNQSLFNRLNTIGFTMFPWWNEGMKTEYCAIICSKFIILHEEHIEKLLVAVFPRWWIREISSALGNTCTCKWWKGTLKRKQ